MDSKKTNTLNNKMMQRCHYKILNIEFDNELENQNARNEKFNKSHQI